MRLVVQRVDSASVAIKGCEVARIGKGLLILVGIERGDNNAAVEFCAEKIAGLRVFDDQDGKMNLSVRDIDGEVLLVSQFTLLGDVRKGKRPSFTAAELPELANELFLTLHSRLTSMGLRVDCGVFRAHMKVSLVNDGPVTILLDSGRLF